jgi:hypothetical protein
MGLVKLVAGCIWLVQLQSCKAATKFYLSVRSRNLENRGIAKKAPFLFYHNSVQSGESGGGYKKTPTAVLKILNSNLSVHCVGVQ